MIMEEITLPNLENIEFDQNVAKSLRLKLPEFFEDENICKIISIDLRKFADEIDVNKKCTFEFKQLENEKTFELSLGIVINGEADNNKLKMIVKEFARLIERWEAWYEWSERSKIEKRHIDYYGISSKKFKELCKEHLILGVNKNEIELYFKDGENKELLSFVTI